jgi:hypothetical protein
MRIGKWKEKSQERNTWQLIAKEAKVQEEGWGRRGEEEPQLT